MSLTSSDVKAAARYCRTCAGPSPRHFHNLFEGRTLKSCHDKDRNSRWTAAQSARDDVFSLIAAEFCSLVPTLLLLFGITDLSTAIQLWYGPSSDRLYPQSTRREMALFGLGSSFQVSPTFPLPVLSAIKHSRSLLNSSALRSQSLCRYDLLGVDDSYLHLPSLRPSGSYERRCFKSSIPILVYCCLDSVLGQKQSSFTR